MNKFINHLKTVINHKRYVAHYCFICGLYKQGILHDLSKFSPTEFWESVKYYQGNRSPINACKEDIGYSMAWFHHRGRNRHHWEYWVDDFEKGVVPKKIPFKYVLEMICDFLGAGKAYEGVYFSIESEYNWWQNKRKVALLHKDTLKLLDILFDKMLKDGVEETLSNKKYLNKLKKAYSHTTN